MHNPILLETQRLILRAFARADLDGLCDQLSDPDVMRYYPAVLSREACNTWLEGILRDYQTNGFGMLAVCLKDTGIYVGQAGIMRRSLNASDHYLLSYLLCREYWRQGYASEAAQMLVDYGFQTLGLHKIEALIRPDNLRSVRLAKRLGMLREHTTEHDGYSHDLYAITR